MQRELDVVVDTGHQLYYLDVVNQTMKDLDELETLNNKAMDVV